VLVAEDGSPIARRGSYKEAPIDVAKLPAYVPGAFIAIEDRRFYSHMGVDPKAIARAVGQRQGRRRVGRRLDHHPAAGQERLPVQRPQPAPQGPGSADRRLSGSPADQDEILSRYLSSVYFGDGAFGLRAAARHYFGKQPEQLSIGEAAMLAGLVKAPSRLAPSNNIEGARERMRVVLGAMVETKTITQAQADAVGDVIGRREPGQAAHRLLLRRLGPAPGSRLDRRALRRDDRQDDAGSRDAGKGRERSSTTIDRDGKVLNITQGALVAMRKDGRVVAMVGGRDYKTSQFNRADGERQPGSSFKLFVYLAALREGMTTTSADPRHARRRSAATCPRTTRANIATARSR
jgi:penicillin-binding protein 1A